jgi:hypothetical protein
MRGRAVEYFPITAETGIMTGAVIGLFFFLPCHPATQVGATIGEHLEIIFDF